MFHFSAGRVVVCVALVAMLLSAVPSASGAIALTQQAQIQIQSLTSPPGLLGANPPIDDIIQLAFGQNGRLMTNSLAVSPVTGLGTDIRTVGIVNLDNLSQNGGAGADFNGLRRTGINPAGNRVVAVFGVQGAALGPTGVNVRFTEGKVWFYEVLGGGNPDFLDPTTWDPATDLALVSEYTLKSQVFGADVDPVAGVAAGGPRDSVAGGPNGQPLSLIPASEMDISGVNTAVGALGQGDFLFVETSEGALANNSFIDNTYTTDLGEDREPVGANNPSVEESLHFITGQTILSLTSLTGAAPGAATAAQQAVLDSIAMAAFGDAFASWGSGGLADWLPTGDPTAAGVSQGDFIASLTMDAQPTHQFGIPEPATFVMWGLGIVVAVGAGRRRLMAKK